MVDKASALETALVEHVEPLVSPAPVVAPTEEPEPEPAGEPDYKALLEKEQADRVAEQTASNAEVAKAKKELNDRRSQDIKLGRESRMQKMIQEMHTAITGGKDLETVTKAALETFSTEEQSLEAEGYAAQINEAADLVEAAASDLNLDNKDEGIARAIDQYQIAKDLFDAGNFERAMARVDVVKTSIQEVRDRISTNGQEDPKLEPRQAAPNLNDSPNGGAAGLGDQGLVNKMASGAYMTSAEIARATTAKNRGIFPDVAVKR